MTTTTDGDLGQTRHELDDAIHLLCGPQTVILGDRTLITDSRWLQLMGAKHGENSQGGGGGGSKSKSPCWDDAIDLSVEIENAVGDWEEKSAKRKRGRAAVPDRLHRISRFNHWRPQDCIILSALAAQIDEWVAKIDALLDPPRRWTVPAPCPAIDCGATTVYRRDSGGDLVRSPALQINVAGCVCLACKASWPPEQFVFLAGLIGSLPESVLG
jgi:hypothetical protein